MARGDLATACAQLDESFNLDPAVGTQLNLATCEARTGKVISALDRFKLALTRLPKDDFRVAFTNEQIAKLSARVARFSFHFVEPPPNGTHVRCDKHEVTTFDGWVSVDPGRHAVVVEAPGRPAKKSEVSIDDGESKQVDLEVPAAMPTHAAVISPIVVAPEPPPAPSSTRRALMFGSFGLAVAGIAVGTVTGIMTANAASTYRDHCNGDGACDPDGLSAAQTGKTVSVVSPVAFSIGAAFAVIGTVLWLTSPSGPSRASR
jgi:hypothetical protein